MVEIVFVTHSTTFDNEARIASGWSDIDLSPLGIQQAHELGERYREAAFDAIFCSDLQRAYKTANFAFGDTFPTVRDARLRECDYGDLTRYPSDEINRQKLERIDTPFPNGESYRQCAERVARFLDALKANYQGKRVMVIGHRATQYGLDHRVLDKPLEVIVSAPFKWQSGWIYELH